MNQIAVRFMSLTGKFTQVREEKFPDMQTATVAVTEYATAGGYRNVKVVDEDMGMSFRFTAITPGGRGGRNVAYAEIDGDFS